MTKHEDDHWKKMHNMNDVALADVVVPVLVDQLDLLEPCLKSILENTSQKFRISVLLDGSASEEQISYAPAILGAMLRGVSWRFAVSQKGFNGALDSALEQCDVPYCVVVPASSFLLDKEWFGKMQMPFTKVQNCGLSFAFDCMAGNTRPPHPWDHRAAVAGSVFMVSRQSLSGSRSAVKFGADGADYATCLMHAMHSLGLSTWAIPSVRISVQKVVGDSHGR